MENMLAKCNKYYFKELCVGMEESFLVTITQDMQDKFCEISGDVNPLHIDRQYAVKEGFRDCIVYGMCTASFYSTLVGVYLPGERCLFHESSVRWIKPVYVGDTLTVKGKIVEMDARFHRIKVKAAIYNQNREKVSAANLMIGVRE